MSVSDGFRIFLKLRRIVVIISILAGAGSYKFGPTVWHKAETEFHAKPQARVNGKTEASSKTASPAKPVFDGPTTTNTDGTKLSGCDLGTVALTNHYETCVSLSKDKDCLLEPSLIDNHNVQLTLTVETKNAKGKVHDMSITQVVARLGKPLEVAVGGFSFSFTPNMAGDSSE